MTEDERRAEALLLPWEGMVSDAYDEIKRLRVQRDRAMALLDRAMIPHGNPWCCCELCRDRHALKDEIDGEKEKSDERA